MGKSQFSMGKSQLSMGKSPFSMEKSSFSMAFSMFTGLAHRLGRNPVNPERNIKNQAARDQPLRHAAAVEAMATWDLRH